MKLKYEFVQVTTDRARQVVKRVLQDEYDFAYAPLMPGEQRLFRETFPEVPAERMPLDVLLFKYVPTGEDAMEQTAVLDIKAGIVHLDVMGWDSKLWEWKPERQVGLVFDRRAVDRAVHGQGGHAGGVSHYRPAGSVRRGGQGV